MSTPRQGIPEYKADEVQLLGRGAFGQAFIANPESSPFVVKKINIATVAHATKGDDADTFLTQKQIGAAAKKLRSEMKTMEAVSGHANIPKFIGSKEEGNSLEIAMSLAPGTPLNKQKLSEPQSRMVMQQLLSALKHCHDNGVAHLDVKPENILFDPETNHATLVDFGQAMFLAPGRETIDKPPSAGTTKYRSWDFQAEKNLVKIDRYAAGKTFETLLGGPENGSPEDQTLIADLLAGLEVKSDDGRLVEHGTQTGFNVANIKLTQ